MKLQAIHQLLLCNNSQMRKIISFSESIYQSDDAYQKHVMEYSKQVTNTQGEKLFSLESKYLKWFNPFYCQNIFEYNEVIKIYEEYYKNKDKSSIQERLENSTFDMNNLALDFFINAIPVPDSLINFLIDILVLKYIFKISQLNDDIEDFVLHLLSYYIYNEATGSINRNSEEIVSIQSTQNSSHMLMEHLKLFEIILQTTENQTFKHVFRKYVTKNDTHEVWNLDVKVKVLSLYFWVFMNLGNKNWGFFTCKELKIKLKLPKWKLKWWLEWRINVIKSLKI